MMCMYINMVIDLYCGVEPSLTGADLGDLLIIHSLGSCDQFTYVVQKRVHEALHRRYHYHIINSFAMVTMLEVGRSEGLLMLT